MATPHDALVKRVFSVREDAIGELKAVLPSELLAALHLDRLEVVSGSFVDPELLQRHTDLLYRVPLRAGGEAFVYVLFEHQSSDDPVMAFRMLYVVRAWEKYLRDHPEARELPLVIPLVLHHDDARFDRFDRTLAAWTTLLVELLTSPDGREATTSSRRAQSASWANADICRACRFSSEASARSSSRK